jgi:hypothetical protein
MISYNEIIKEAGVDKRAIVQLANCAPRNPIPIEFGVQEESSIVIVVGFSCYD